VRLAKQLVKLMMRQRWRPVEVAADGYRLEVRPYHGKIEAGFILWRVGEDGRLQPVISGHTENGYLLTAEGFRLDLPAETARAIERLLQQAPR
jgi:hypothetical protein